MTAAFTTTRHCGELPWGASFGFSNDVEVALPYDSRTNDFTVGTEWTNGRSMLRVAYNGSWFNNLDDTLVWDSPLRLDDSTSAPGRGRMALWPSNSAQTVSAAGYTKLAHRTQLTGFVSYGVWSNDEPLQPFTINAALPQLALPRATAEAEAHVFSTNLNLVSRPRDRLAVQRARCARYDYDNQTPRGGHPAVHQLRHVGRRRRSTGGPELYAHSRTNFDADATWSGLQPLALTAGYTRNNSGYDFRIFESTGENVLAPDGRRRRLAVGHVPRAVRARRSHRLRPGRGAARRRSASSRRMRHYDLANRTPQSIHRPGRHRRRTICGRSASRRAWARTTYDDSYFGLQESTFRTFSLAADYRQANGFGGGGSYNYERYAGLQQSRSASPGQENDPLRDWTTDSTERVNYFSIYATPPRIGRNTEARVSYDFSYARGQLPLRASCPAARCRRRRSCPNVFNKLQQLHLDVRHRLSNQLAATFSYLYEPFRVYDFAFDPTRGQRHRPAQLAGAGVRLSPVHGALRAVGLRYFW